MSSTIDEVILRALLAVPGWVLKDSSTGLCRTLTRIIWELLDFLIASIPVTETHSEQ